MLTQGDVENDYYTFHVNSEDGDYKASDNGEPEHALLANVPASSAESTRSVKIKKRAKPLCRRLGPEMTPQHKLPMKNYLSNSGEGDQADGQSDVAEDCSNHDSVSQKVMGKITTEMEQRLQTNKGLWSYYSDFILQNLGESSILLLENGEEKVGITGITQGPLTDYFQDAHQRMHFAKWFRPLTLIILTACLYDLITAAFQADAALAEAAKSASILRLHDSLTAFFPSL